MKTIGIDMDGCIYDWHYEVYQFYVRFRNYAGTFTSFWSGYFQTLPQDEVQFILDVDTFYSTAPPSKDCLEFLDTIKDSFEIYYVTSRPEFVRLTTEQYMRRYKFPYQDNLIFSEEKDMIARKYKFSYAIDDLVSNIAILNKVTTAIMIARPWNKDFWYQFPTARSLMDSLKYIEV